MAKDGEERPSKIEDFPHKPTIASLIQRLPQELSDHILDYATTSNIPQSTIINITDPSYKSPTFLQINHASRSTNSQRYYPSNTFSFADMSICHTWLSVLESSHRSALRTLRYDLRTDDVSEFKGVHAMEVGCLMEDVRNVLNEFLLMPGLEVWVSTSAHGDVCGGGRRWCVVRLRRCGYRWREAHEWDVVPSEEIWEPGEGRLEG